MNTSLGLAGVTLGFVISVVAVVVIGIGLHRREAPLLQSAGPFSLGLLGAALLAVVAMAALPLLVGAGAALVLWRSLRGQRRIDGAPSMRPDAPNGASASSMRRRAAAGFGDSTVIAQRRE